MSGIRDIDDFKGLFLNDIPMLDVRAPIEFNQGAFSHAVNIPLLNDKEREIVGTTYKNEGQDAAVKLGHELVCGDVKAERLEKWVEFAKQNPNGCLYCFRGGMRSHLVQEWLKEAGVDYPLVTGGYKSLRRFLIDKTDELVTKKEFIVISGSTGVGKTIVINKLSNSIDLEGLANHRGSSFGGVVSGQPSQIDFENRLAVKLLKLTEQFKGTLFVEDESRTIGNLGLPISLINKMKESKIIVLEDSIENRIEAIKKDYVVDLLAEYKNVYADNAFAKFSEFLVDSLFRVRKRLGLQNHKEILVLLENALSEQGKTDSTSLHKAWISELLIKYYDPMYNYQLDKKKDRVIFKGNKEEVLEYCSKLS